MNKKILIAGAMALAVPASLLADVKVNLDPATAPAEISIMGVKAAELASAREPGFQQTVKLTDGQGVLPLGIDTPAFYIVTVGNSRIPMYAEAKDALTLDKELNITGSAIMDDFMKLQSQFTPIEEEFAKMQQSGQVSREAVEALQQKYQCVAKKFIADNPASPAVPLAIYELDGENFIDAYNAATPEMKQNTYFVLVEQKLPQVQHQIEVEKKQTAMASGTMDAPDFTLNDLQGKPVSLSSFKEKWVILDFWGSWCGWCIKGFPALKSAYEKYKDRLTVIGIDNNETEAQWKAGVEKHQLPWVNVYNPQGDPSGICAAYTVEGFPTKVIINPEGKIVDITTGEDPSFFERLDGFMSK